MKLSAWTNNSVVYGLPVRVAAQLPVTGAPYIIVAEQSRGRYEAV